MGIVVKFRGHRRSPGGTRTPKTRGSIRPSSRAKINENLAGIRRLTFQLETARADVPATLAAAVVPPSSEITFSTDVSIPGQYPQIMDKSSIHETGIEGGSPFPDNPVVDSRGKVNQRIRDMLHVEGLSQAGLCKAIGEPKTKFNNYINDSSTNLIPPDVATKICDKFDLSLDWIYRGKLSHLRADFRDKILQLEQARAAGQKKVARK